LVQSSTSLGSRTRRQSRIPLCSSAPWTSRMSCRCRLTMSGATRTDLASPSQSPHAGVGQEHFNFWRRAFSSLQTDAFALLSSCSRLRSGHVLAGRWWRGPKHLPDLLQEALETCSSKIAECVLWAGQLRATANLVRGGGESSLVRKAAGRGGPESRPSFCLK
jgi:hypothetical protein